MSTNYVICILLVTVFIFIVAGCKISCNMKGGTSYRPIDYTPQDNARTQKQSLESKTCPNPPCYYYFDPSIGFGTCIWTNPKGKIVKCPF